MLEPLNDHLLVHPVEQERRIEGVLLPDVAREDMKFGKVVTCGPRVADVKKDDLVMFGPYAGMPVSLEGVEFILMREGEVKGRIIDV